MAEPKEPTSEVKKPQQKTVPASDLFAVKKQAEKLQEELANTKAELADIKAELEIAHTDVEDSDEVARVKQYLLGLEKQVNAKVRDVEAREAKLKEDLASYEERDKESRVQALASEHQVEVDAIKDAEDPEKEALRLVNERLAKEKLELEGKTPESVFETVGGGVIKKKIADMNDAEFAQKEKELKAEALSTSEIVRTRL